MKKPVLRPVDRLLLRICEQVSTPRAVAVKLLLEHGELDQLASLRADPTHYQTEAAYWADAQVTDFLRKDESLQTTVDRKAAALVNFWKAERQCALTNLRLLPYLHVFGGKAFEAPPLDDEIEDGVARMILAVRKKVTAWLGRPPSNWDGRFGPGATYGDRGRLTTIPDKMSSRPTLTSSAWPYLFGWTATAWATACATAPCRRDPEFVAGNRFTTVPKDCLKHRGIAVEPSINLYYQLGLGRVIRKRLMRAGINLLEAQDIHRRQACEASREGGFATLDLSNASDTVSRTLVQLLIPEDWYQLLSWLRSPKTFVEGKWVHLEKFSSMGNGFTFELETVIFAAITAAVHETLTGSECVLSRDVFVFGDDIICRTEVVEGVIAALRYFGFEINSTKSFVGGPFRESCGGDFFRGVPVRAYFQKDELSEPQHYIALANGLRRACQGYPDRWALIRRAWLGALDELPAELRRLRGPERLGDLVIHDEDESLWQIRQRSCRRYIRVYRPARWKRVGWNHFRPEVVLATALYGASDERGGLHPEKGADQRDNVSGFKVGWTSLP